MKLRREAAGLTRELAEHTSGTTGTTGATVGFVPTMGALHRGHLSLVERARAECDTVVVSIFVNPTQFNDPHDLENYPRTEQEDLQLLRQAGVDWVFAPSVSEIYPEPDTRVFDFGPLDRVMEGACRPGHFNGVAQVVSRLFEIVRPARAYFGEKDFQQLAIVRRMVEELGLPIQVVGCPIVRDADGLAKSSRNLLLTPAARAAAPGIYRALSDVAAVARRDGYTVAQTKALITAQIDQSPELRTEYAEIVDAATLQPVSEWGALPLRCCVAVRAGNIRLIDNIGM